MKINFGILPANRVVSVLTMLMLAGIIIHACKKDNEATDTSGNTIAEVKRLVGWTYEYYDNKYTMELEYSYDKIITINYYAEHSNSDLIRKKTVEYSDTIVIVKDFSVNNGQLDEVGKKTVEFSGINVDRIVLYSQHGIDMQITYNYMDELLTEFVIENTPFPSVKAVNTYSDSMLIRTDYYKYQNAAFELFSRSLWEYSDDKIALINYQVISDDIWINKSKAEFLYQGNNVIINEYDFTSGNWEFIDDMEVTLDLNGNTIKFLYSTGFIEDIKEEFSYEPGNGNFNDIILYPEDKFIPFRIPYGRFIPYIYN